MDRTESLERLNQDVKAAAALCALKQLAHEVREAETLEVVITDSQAHLPLDVWRKMVSLAEAAQK